MEALVVSVARAEAELASDALWGLGVDAVEERDIGRGRVELWTTVGGGSDVLGRAKGAFPRWAWRTEEVDPTVADTWRQHAQPVVVADSVMTIPAWRADVAPEEGMIAVRIEPGASFGLGDHPTTRLALEHLVDAIGERPGCRLLDVGCGSGVLSIAGVLLGAARARGVDVSSAAVEAARHNVELNGAGGRVEIDDVPAAELEGTYDIVVANILAPVLVALADDLRRLCAPGGLIIVSGILSEGHDHVLDALRPAVPVRTTLLDSWAGITLRTRGTPPPRQQ